VGEHATLYPSKQGTPVVTFIHSGGHEFNRRAGVDRKVFQGTSGGNKIARANKFLATLRLNSTELELVGNPYANL